MSTVQLNPTNAGDYTSGLVRRLEREGISHGEVAREMGVTKTQFSRWVTENDERRVEPRMSNAVKIEAAIKKILARRARRKTA